MSFKSYFSLARGSFGCDALEVTTLDHLDSQPSSLPVVGQSQHELGSTCEVEREGGRVGAAVEAAHAAHRVSVLLGGGGRKGGRMRGGKGRRGRKRERGKGR